MSDQGKSTADLLVLSFCEITHGQRAQGAIYNDQSNRFADGEVVNTSRIVSVNSNDRTFVTKSGTVYRYHVARMPNANN